ncbi:hypothetical protein GCM10010431_05280 [Streptomyces kunmingensis]
MGAGRAVPRPRAGEASRAVPRAPEMRTTCAISWGSGEAARSRGAGNCATSHDGAAPSNAPAKLRRVPEGRGELRDQPPPGRTRQRPEPPPHPTPAYPSATTTAEATPASWLSDT